MYGTLFYMRVRALMSADGQLVCVLPSLPKPRALAHHLIGPGLSTLVCGTVVGAAPTNAVLEEQRNMEEKNAPGACPSSRPPNNPSITCALPPPRIPPPVFFSARLTISHDGYCSLLLVVQSVEAVSQLPVLP